MSRNDSSTVEDAEQALLCMTYGGYAENEITLPNDIAVWGFDCVDVLGETEKTDLQYRPILH